MRDRQTTTGVGDGARPTVEAGTSVGPAMTALLLGVAHVRRHYAGPSGGGAAVEPMVAFNILRELDVLLAHAIEEAARVASLPPPRRRSSTRAKLRLLPSYAADKAEDAAHAAVDAVRRGLMPGQRAASSCLVRPDAEAFSGDLAAGAAVNARIASRLGDLARRSPASLSPPRSARPDRS